ncbi:MAG TPA: LUD domain-containing protein, partial [Candidatus Saccharimonadales bacterium]|nr:LUD domain-containing protein [Candidatus Saccharimonadales bacterium]
MDKWNKLATKKIVNTTIKNLKNNGIDGVVVKSGEDAKKKVLELIPEGSDVMTMTSETLKSIGIPEEIDKSGKFDSVREKLSKMDRSTQSGEMQKLGAAPKYTIGSVHAVTEDGQVIIASNTGSQLPAYVYGSEHVIWVVGIQKIVKNVEEGMKRIYDYVLPLESERAKKAYG